jgi:hypothetical protein
LEKLSLRIGLYLVAAAVLVAGLCSAVLIHVTAGDAPESAAVHEMVNSKPYQHELRRFGGKAAVLFDELNRWFDGLWQGKTLAFTVAWISIFISLGVFLFARRLPRGA